MVVNKIKNMLMRIKAWYITAKVPKITYTIDNTSIIINGLKLFFKNRREDRVYLEIGSKCIVQAQFIFESDSGKIEIYNNVHIGNATFICRNNICIGDDVTIAWGVTFYDHNSHSIYWNYRKNDNNQCYEDYIRCKGNNIANKDWSNVLSRPIIVKDKVWIGFDAVILKGVTIGEGAVVAARSVVTKDVPSYTVVAGNPAVVVKEITSVK